jgi:hypothetical protein
MIYLLAGIVVLVVGLIFVLIWAGQSVTEAARQEEDSILGNIFWLPGGPLKPGESNTYVKTIPATGPCILRRVSPMPEACFLTLLSLKINNIEILDGPIHPWTKGIRLEHPIDESLPIVRITVKNETNRERTLRGLLSVEKKKGPESCNSTGPTREATGRSFPVAEQVSPEERQGETLRKKLLLQAFEERQDVTFCSERGNKIAIRWVKPDTALVWFDDVYEQRLSLEQLKVRFKAELEEQ